MELQIPRDRAQVRASDVMTPAGPRVLATAAHIQRRPQPCAEAGRLTTLPRPSLRFLFRFPLPLLFRFRLLRSRVLQAAGRAARAENPSRQ